MRSGVLPNGTSCSVVVCPEHSCAWPSDPVVATLVLPHCIGLGGGGSVTSPPRIVFHDATRRAGTEMVSGGALGSNGTSGAPAEVRCSASTDSGLLEGRRRA